MVTALRITQWTQQERLTHDLQEDQFQGKFVCFCDKYICSFNPILAASLELR